ncbi:MAG: MBL fold metallo-hydrolase [Mesorhizobium sp.]|nr:MBL fold metallo-hydrolase [Mesorhizobium sp.]MBL8578934.1 MBL fold metallo-hydrolase [Mesorhizobium sp.]
MPLHFNLDFDACYGEPVGVLPGVARVTANNPGPFTFRGTNTYLVGNKTLAVIDPGPERNEHFDALRAAIAGRPVSHIFVSHTHRDHSPLAARLAEATGAKVLAQGPHRAARAFSGKSLLDSSADLEFSPDIRLTDGQVIEGDGWALRTVLTPGHAANHAAFALEGAGALFSGDHVMGWSTTIVAPPDGSMADYMASLDKLIERRDGLLLPAHGGPITEPRDYMLGLREHRLARERAILDRLRKGDSTIEKLVASIYRDTDPKLYPAASLSVLAHLEDLVERGLAETDGAVSIGGIFRPV